MHRQRRRCLAKCRLRLRLELPHGLALDRKIRHASRLLRLWQYVAWPLVLAEAPRQADSGDGLWRGCADRWIDRRQERRGHWIVGRWRWFSALHLQTAKASSQLLNGASLAKKVETS